MKSRVSLVLLMALVMSGCRFKPVVVFSDGDRYEGEGIVFLVPSESSRTSSGDGGIDYEGESVKASTNGKTLTVDGKPYGTVQRGDEVDLREKGTVKVNGKPRSPEAKTQEAK